MLEQWVEVHHRQDGPIRLHDYDSLSPFLLIERDAELVQFGGSGWADEWRWTTQPLNPGTTSLASFGGLQPHLQRSPVALLAPSGPSSEHGGDVIGVSVAWAATPASTSTSDPSRPQTRPISSDFARERTRRCRVRARPRRAIRDADRGVDLVLRRAARGDSTVPRLDPGRVLGTARRRPLVVNNWEATFFDFDEAAVVDLIERAGALGADVFLLDDGWFGTSHPRDDDTTSLGDWDPDPAKLPDGLPPLVQAATAAGLRMGIWVEPEMVNPVSDLHDSHPEWVLRNRREPRLHRNQLVLDTLRPEVRDFTTGVVDRTLASAAGVSYVKWDANRPLTEPGSATLAPDRQSNVWVDHVHATWQVMAEVARRHPDVELMLCASGGGRTDHGTLRWFHEFWTSDNTDPVTRVRMQWACSHFFPSSAMAAHVTRWGERPLELGCAVALSGRFGVDLDLRGLSVEEDAILRRAVSFAARTQDLVQHGELVRLVSPVDGDDRTRAALVHLDEERRRGVVFAYQLDAGTPDESGRTGAPEPSDASAGSVAPGAATVLRLGE